MSEDINEIQSDVLFVDELDNALDYLQTTINFFERTDNFKWKWIAISTFHTLYSLCILNLQGTSPHEVESNGNNEDDNVKIFNDKGYFQSKIVKNPNLPGYKIEWIPITEEEFNLSCKSKSKKTNTPKLIGFWVAFARVQDSGLYMRRYMNSKALEVSDSELKSVEFLNYFRNDLIHFLPKSMGTHIEIIKSNCLNIIRIMKFLISDTMQIIYRDPEQKQNFVDLINLLEDKLKH